jgi:hypothetical protein
METDSTVAVALMPDEALRKLPHEQLKAKIHTIHAQLGGCVQIAVAANSAAIYHAVALGQVLAEAMHRYEGEFEEWLDSIVERDAEGKPALSVTTARRYRTLYEKRFKIFPVDGSEPPPRNLVEAYIKAGILPEPQPGEADPHAIKPLFRLTFALPTVPPEDWPPAERRAFLTRTEPLLEMVARVKALAE